MKRFLPFILLLVAFALLSVWMPKKTAIEKRQFSERVNLALRQVGHQLLMIQGDSVSAIPPIRQLAGNEYVLRLEGEFDYDTLPNVLANAFKDFDIGSSYQVAIKKCDSDTLILGYNLQAFENGEVACKGREDWSECSKIGVVFDHDSKFALYNTLAVIGMVLVGLLLVFQVYFLRKYKKAKGVVNHSKNGQKFRIGSSNFDFQNQSISVKGQKKSLTFRENKLLQFFAKHPNVVLEREKILSEVWGDEGVIVGRSLDVFVSRLRKILREDDTLQLKSVHGVGYRLEVASD